MRARREAPLPKYGVSIHGRRFQIKKIRRRNDDGEKLYRLFFLDWNVLGNQEWTARDLRESGVIFSDKRPRKKNSGLMQTKD